MITLSPDRSNEAGGATMASKRSKATERAAVVAGASGLVGRELVNRLSRTPAYGRIVVLTRHALGLRHPGLVEAPARFDALGDVLAPLMPQSVPIDAYCCLGTTIRAAGSQQAFHRVDHDFVLAFARWAADVPVARLVVISALGADAASRVFYNRVKGETESDLRTVAGSRLVLVRPSLLDGRRTESRWGETFALALTRPVRALLPVRIRPVAVEDVAQSMIDAALAAAPSAVLESAAIQGAARRAEAKANS
jgi:uncharacterized protein YbjT (DUF2867 family)